MIKNKTKVLLEMRPALEGFAGIPQETRLLFRGLRMLEGFDAQGMIQTSTRILARGTSRKRSYFRCKSTESRRINRYSRVVISIAEKPFSTMVDKVLDFFERRIQSTRLTMGTLFGVSKVKLSEFEALHFKDFIWRTLFAKTLPASDFKLVAGVDQYICTTPWQTMHRVGLNSLNFFPRPIYPRLDTSGIDIFIGQTPYPARVNAKTAFVIRYHDAIPVFMPHTIADKSLHQATHLYALRSNVNSGAYFACVSESTRADLLKMFPEAKDRAVTIHNMVSHHYYEGDTSAELVPGIVRSRLYAGDPSKGLDMSPKFFSLREKENFYCKHLGQKPFKYLLIVSTIEPRKNHTRLLAAWEVLKADVDPDMKMIVVGTLGWETSGIVTGFKEWIDRGQLFTLHAVPAPDLRVLYRHATATVCPSLGEGFDFSGVESMRSGGVVIASEIPVHQEVYGNAAEYFDPYSTASLVKAIKKVVYDGGADEVQQNLRCRGREVSSRYLPEQILPQWHAFLGRVASERLNDKAAGHGTSQPAPALNRALQAK
jgi:glycosyltransferase involved in cell wall biosynthesis